jgi:hypothetical protein
MPQTSTLNLHDLPAVDDKAAIWAFAMSFNGYDAHGSFEAAAVAAGERTPESVPALRNELFVVARASRHGGTELYLQRYEELLPIFQRLLAA